MCVYVYIYTYINNTDNNNTSDNTNNKGRGAHPRVLHALAGSQGEHKLYVYN